MTRDNRRKQLNIMGIRGIPAEHGGFETFAAHLAPYMRDRGWRVNVYCQLEAEEKGEARPDFEDEWNGIRRIHLGTRGTGSAGSFTFDWRCILDVQRREGVDLVLGYNTALFTLVSRLRGRRVLMNMDGVEWQRAKWPIPVKLWFYINEFAGANLASLPIADHPEIALHLRRHLCRRAIVIPYGADPIDSASTEPVLKIGLQPKNYLLSIARIEPENSILEIVRGFCGSTTNHTLVVLGALNENRKYHRMVRSAANQKVVFPGAIYDKETVSALRFYAFAYLHGHQVGGTNPSLVEALGAGNAVIAHDNRFNRWVAGPEQFYFNNHNVLSQILNNDVTDGVAVERARRAARRRHTEQFQWQSVLSRYAEAIEYVNEKK